VVNRYDHRDIDNEMELHKEGCWVTYEDYEKLKEQLKQSEILLKASSVVVKSAGVERLARTITTYLDREVGGNG
jgi:formylmethanofuran dehydrogenase subunit A